VRTIGPPREFGKRVPVRELRNQATSQSAPPAAGAGAGAVAPQPKARGLDPDQLKKSLLAIGLTVAVVGGMFLLPAMGQCDGHRGALGVDWRHAMKAGLEGAVRGVAAGRGAAISGR
jgi:hypothetical protein